MSRRNSGNRYTLKPSYYQVVRNKSSPTLSTLKEFDIDLKEQSFNSTILENNFSLGNDKIKPMKSVPPGQTNTSLSLNSSNIFQQYRSNLKYRYNQHQCSGSIQSNCSQPFSKTTDTKCKKEEPKEKVKPKNLSTYQQIRNMLTPYLFNITPDKYSNKIHLPEINSKQINKDIPSGYSNTYEEESGYFNTIVNKRMEEYYDKKKDFEEQKKEIKEKLRKLEEAKLNKRNEENKSEESESLSSITFNTNQSDTPSPFLTPMPSPEPRNNVDILADGTRVMIQNNPTQLVNDNPTTKNSSPLKN